ncbi:unnamed protein product [Auanema sp. JU1783]|nr:unnamed protein product [Auanema sp. JU1783]
MVLVSKGDFIWIEPLRGESSIPVGARVIEQDHGRLKILDDNGTEQWLAADRRIRLMHPTSIEGVEDMCQLGDYHESAILRNIFMRYRQKHIYTFTGSILIAVNPYSDIPIYTAEQIRLYKRRKIGELPPHIFAIADNSYTNMRNANRNQSIIISGESGAGKTESTKLVLQFLATISGQHSWIEQQVLEANPILEAFGNAKTVRNDNSSRFGKYIDVHFNSTGCIEGARIEQYLLEKSRIVSQSENERNYHIFYCLLSGLTAEEKKDLELTTTSDYFYLTQGRTLVAEGRDDGADLAEIRSAMKVLMFKDQEVWSIFKLLAGILHIGNIRYRCSQVDNMEAVDVSDASNIVRIARLLQIREQNLLDALTSKTLVTRDERVVKRLTAQQAVDTRDALVKGIYGRLFIYIVSRINDAIFKPRSDGRRTSIGVLDIFGFECFENNSFEQLCINYANEALQQFFIKHVFKMEQAEYDQEQISWRQIQFVDNQQTLELIALQPMNILSIIDEESIFPKATDYTMLNKLHSNHSKSHSGYLKPKSDLQKAFGVNHFAGPVFYNVKGFLEKNRDSFHSDLSSLVSSTKMVFMKRLFEDVEYSDSSTRKKGSTVSSQFRRSLESLMSQLVQTEPFFIRCIKPNEYKRALMMDRELVLRQLRYSGMMETIRIRRSGYPVRHSYERFVHRYRLLVNGIGPSHKVDCHKAAKKICRYVFGHDADFQLGKTKVFLKDQQDLFLENAYYRVLNERATTIQKAVRGWQAKKRFDKQRDAAVIIQKIWRGYDQRKRYKQIIVGVSRLQALLRTKQLVQHYQSLRHVIIQFQARCRGAIVRWKVDEMLKQGRKKLYVTTDVIREPVPEDVREEELVGQLFDFLPSDSKMEGSIDGESMAGSVRGSKTLTKEPEAICVNIPQTTDPFEGEDLSKYQFSKFAATYMSTGVTPTHIKRPLRSPLLNHDDHTIQMGALAAWMTILRFMGDLPDVKLGSVNSADGAYDKTPVMTKLYATLGRRYSRKDVEEAGAAADVDALGGNRTLKKGMGKKIISMTLKRKSKLNDIQSAESMDSISSSSSGFNALLDIKPMSSLDKLHYIVGLGILREELRDEIYCQLCKQLSENPSKLSAARGWILLSLCVGCFAPSPRFIKYLYCFIREKGPSGSGYSSYIEERLRRTVQNGPRRQPSSYVELQASKSKKPIVLAVTFMDGTVKTLCADSATTSSELCTQLADKVGLKDRFGFSLYIALFDKVSSLGCGSDHVMDAISQCEQYAKEQGRQERNAPWRLFYRKEIFAPWHDAKEDSVATNLIYQQVIRGIKYGEYRCEKEDDLATLAAQQYFIDEGALDVNRLESQLHNYLPDVELNGKEMARERWTQLIMHQYRKRFTKSATASSVKEDVVSFAKFNWPLLYSRFYEALKFTGPPLPKNEVIIAVNWTGIYVVDDQEQVLLEFSYPEITGVVYGKGKRIGADTCTIRSITGDEYAFQSPNAEDIRELVSNFLEGLKMRSKYLVATQSQKAEGSGGYLEFEKGDLLTMSNNHCGKDLLNEVMVKGQNQRTNQEGMIIRENVYILPTMARPTATVLKLFPKTANLDSLNNNNHKQVSIVDHTFDKPYTLEKFAAEHFRSVPKRSGSIMTLRRKESSAADRWRFSREPIDGPLLKKLDGLEDPSREAVQAYISIMRYMGDLQHRRGRLGTDLTDIIFRAALAWDILKDELYCQIIKQLTLNPSMLSEERGWELMWLIAGLFPPSPLLMREVSMFLKSRHHSIALDCLNRIQKISKSGSRKYPPHLVEVEAIQQKTTQIYHKIFFPDQTDEAIEVDSSTKAKDICQRIAKRLYLKSPKGFYLVVKIKEKARHVPENDFFFDYVRQLSDEIQSTHSHKESQMVPINYQVFFMRMLWMDVVPGDDVNADLIFHYYQEVPKYLLGYHNVTKQTAVEIGALILRAMTNDSKNAPLAQVPQLLHDLVPKDILSGSSSSEWKKLISNSYVHVEHLTSDQAKIEFLRTIHKWPTFGSAFFPVSQMSDVTLPEKLLISINQQGVHIYNIENKNLIVHYPFNVICNWTSGNTYFNMTVGNVLKGNDGKKLLLDTTMGYKMDGLLTAYIQALIAGQAKKPPKKSANESVI